MTRLQWMCVSKLWAITLYYIINRWDENVWWSRSRSRQPQLDHVFLITIFLHPPTNSGLDLSMDNICFILTWGLTLHTAFLSSLDQLIGNIVVYAQLRFRDYRFCHLFKILWESYWNIKKQEYCQMKLLTLHVDNTYCVF